MSQNESNTIQIELIQNDVGSNPINCTFLKLSRKLLIFPTVQCVCVVSLRT